MSSRYAIYLGSLSALTLLVLVATAPGCGPECNRAGDCGPQQVCYSGTCSNVQANTTKCNSDDECNADMSSNLFQCIGERCILRNISTPPDAGPQPDTGVGDTGVAPPDTGVPPPDGGMQPDTGMMQPDSGMGDTGVGDTGVGDAGMNDAGMTGGAGTITVNIDTVATDFSTGGPTVLYDANMGRTIINGTSANSDTIEIIYGMQDPVTGMALCSGGVNTNINLIRGGVTYSGQMAATPDCLITVTAYPLVGMNVVGSFQGSVSDGTTTLSLTAGLFDALRLQ